MATIHKIAAENFLSLESVDIELGALNVLVGPNGAGKTNILTLFQFLGNVARQDLLPAINAMQGFDNLLFRGIGRRDRIIRIHFSGVISQHASAKAPDEYTLSFWQRMLRRKDGDTQQITQRTEEIVIKRTAGRGRRITLSGGSLKIEAIGDQKRRRPLPDALPLQTTATGLATIRRLGEEYEASGVEALAQVFEQLRLFEIDVASVRRPSRKSAGRLAANASNLASYLLTLSQEHPAVFERICDDVQFVLPGFQGFEFIPFGGSDEAIRLDIKEDKLTGTTPLARASYGTIRAIALFAMLNDPTPPQLTCLEEIDHGLHPHALDRVVERLREASAKTQIVLATHSPALVNRIHLSELIIVERDSNTGGTRVTRPNQALVETLQNETGYALGELWFSGSIGGAL
jgi:predicted ATPase